ncbi:MAG: hypothetical protein OEV41_13970, partial [Gammaproteobacteria bacterium]|nr:hypothetical protein [Gammaproteobacteria bacterium]
KAAADISRAKALEEFSDKMAETLFGNEDLEAIAAEVIANPPPGYEAPSGDHNVVSPPKAGPSPVMLDEPLAELELAEEPAAKAAQPASKRTATSRPRVDGLRESQALRAEMLGTMNRPAEPAPAPTRSAPAAKSAKPESIENQINTSITQRMAALDLSRLADGDAEDEKDDKKRGGFFSRFRKSN